MRTTHGRHDLPAKAAAPPPRAWPWDKLVTLLGGWAGISGGMAVASVWMERLDYAGAAGLLMALFAGAGLALAWVTRP